MTNTRPDGRHQRHGKTQDLSRADSLHEPHRPFEGAPARSHRLPEDAYLGHKVIRSTLVYLNITPELLQEAAERFRRKATIGKRNCRLAAIRHFFGFVASRTAGDRAMH